MKNGLLGNFGGDCAKCVDGIVSLHKTTAKTVVLCGSVAENDMIRYD